MATVCWSTARSIRTELIAALRTRTAPISPVAFNSAENAAARRSTSAASPSGITTPAPVRPCLSELARDFSLPSGVFGPVLSAAFRRLARIRASLAGIGSGPFDVGRRDDLASGLSFWTEALRLAAFFRDHPKNFETGRRRLRSSEKIGPILDRSPGSLGGRREVPNPDPIVGVDTRSDPRKLCGEKASRSGGMADAPDSKSGGVTPVWVQVPPSVL